MSKEWWDILDAYGVPTGSVFLRGGDAGWPQGRFHLVVAVCVQRDDGLVLLTQRAAGRNEFPLDWEFPGGSALAGEPSRNAASRELAEETGIRVPPEALTPVGRFVETSALVDFYVVSVPQQTQPDLQASEVAAGEWVCLDEVERRWREGVMAQPWTARLAALWPPAKEALRPSTAVCE